MPMVIMSRTTVDGSINPSTELTEEEDDMGRISRAQMFMDMARAASRRSTCFRLNVGAIITLDNSPVSVGWNGQASGAPHCAGNDCPGIVPGKCGTLHAEQNAIRKAEAILKDSPGPVSAVDLYVTHSPCLQCCEFIRDPWRDIWIKRLFFEVPYRNSQHLGMLSNPTGPLSKQRVTEVYEVTPAGYTVEYFSRKVVELP